MKTSVKLYLLGLYMKITGRLPCGSFTETEMCVDKYINRREETQL